jgi:hypothetical protein
MDHVFKVIALVLYAALAFFMGYGLGDYDARQKQAYACELNQNTIWECN